MLTPMVFVALLLADPRVDAETGRDKSNYPPHVLFDFKHLKLEIDVPDIETPAFTATETLTCTPIGEPRRELTLDAKKPIQILAASIDGKNTPFTREPEHVTITLPEPIAPGREITLVLRYEARDPFKQGCGLNWFKTRKGHEDKGAMVYSQGEANWNSLWFPCHDFPNEKLTTEIICTVDREYKVISNGRLLDQKPATDGRRATWHWLQDKPHATYLVMLGIGKWDVADVASPERPNLSMPVYGPPGSADELKTIFKNTPKMVAFFERTLDEPYPWDKYAQVIVRNFNWGGMENTSATVLAEYAAGGSPEDHDDLIAHELAHQWTGDLVTCKSWAHLWLNEGWATYLEWIWQEHVRGGEAYLSSARDARRKLSILPLEPLPNGVPMVSDLYGEPDDTFTKAEDPYVRGAFVLHMLRERLGDEVFWKSMRLYIDRYKFQSAETDDFRKVFEEVSGQSLERFFRQWTLRPGMPNLKVTHTYDAGSRKLSFTVAQTQTIDGLNPAYAFRLPVYLTFGDKGEWRYLDIDARETTQAFDVPGSPDNVRIDPRCTVLAKYEDDGSNRTPD